MSRAGRAELAGHLARWLFPGGGVAVAVAWQGDALRPLAPAEAEAVRSAFPKRRREFALGRHCAHLALDGIDRPAPALAVGPDRGPLWPEGATGSISHSGGMAIAAATRRRPGTGIGTGGATGIGLDIEHRSGVLPRATWHLVFSAAERARLACPGPLGAADRAHLWFSAKESSFKALAAATGERPALARLEIGEDAQGMPVAVTLAGTPWRCRIRHVVTAQRLITSAVLEPPACQATEAPCPEIRPS